MVWGHEPYTHPSSLFEFSAEGCVQGNGRQIRNEVVDNLVSWESTQPSSNLGLL